LAPTTKSPRPHPTSNLASISSRMSMNLTDQESFEFLEALFPGGLKDPALIAELCPEGWEYSPLFACYHPSPEVRYEEHLAFSRNLTNLFSRRKKHADPNEAAEPEEPEPTF